MEAEAWGKAVDAEEVDCVGDFLLFLFREFIELFKEGLRVDDFHRRDLRKSAAAWGVSKRATFPAA